MTSSKPGPRRWGIAAAAGMTVFVGVVVLSTGSSSVPVGSSDAMSGMSMSARDGRLAVTLRDIDDVRLRLPGGRSGIVVFVEPRGCGRCVAAVRSASAAIRRAGNRAELVVVMADPATSRGDVAAFNRSVGASHARYAVDDRNGGLASLVGATSLGRPVVFGVCGRTVPRPGSSTDQLAAALLGVCR